MAAAGCVALPAGLAGLAVLGVPVPFAEDLVRARIVSQVAGQFSCPGSTAAAPQVTVGGGRLVRQALDGRLAEIRLVLPDTALGGAQHARFEATLRGVTQPGAGRTHVERIDATTTIGFADLPGPATGPRPTFGRGEDGTLTVATQTPAGAASSITGTVYLSLAISSGTLTATPQRLQLLGQDVPVEQAAGQTGGVRVQALPALPPGVAYRSVTAERDGLHLTIGGVAVQPLSELPTRAGDLTLSYSARDGLLGIATSAQVPLVGTVPLTIFTRPVLRGSSLALVPSSVTILGSDRPPSDVVASVVLSQVPAGMLTRALPVLPKGVRYIAVGVDDAGLRVGVSGVAVRTYAELQQTPEGQGTVFGAEGGLLTATSAGSAPGSPGPPLVMTTTPRLVNGSLDLVPRSFRLFGVDFPAATVLAQTHAPDVVVPLAPLPSGMTYTAVDVLPEGLRLTVGGQDVTLGQGLPGGTGCAS